MDKKEQSTVGKNGNDNPTVTGDNMAGGGLFISNRHRPGQYGGGNSRSIRQVRTFDYGVESQCCESCLPRCHRCGQADTIEDGISASPLIITCLTTYDATIQAMEPAGDKLAGRTIISLNSGTPAGARKMADWAAEHGARFLDGAVKNVP